MKTTHNYILDFEYTYQANEIIDYLTQGYGDEGVNWDSEPGDENTMRLHIHSEDFMPSHFKAWLENHYVNIVSESIKKEK